MSVTTKADAVEAAEKALREIFEPCDYAFEGEPEELDEGYWVPCVVYIRKEG